MKTKPVSFAILFVVAFIFLSACDLSFGTNSAATPTEEKVLFATATLPATATPAYTSTPNPTALPQTVAGKLTTQVNVRSGPGTTFSQLGLLNQGKDVEILAKTSDGKWLLILYSAGDSTQGWVAAQFVTLPADALEGLPVFEETSPTAPAETPQVGISARILQTINVRSGPGVNFDALGLVEADSTITVTGKNETSTWLQVAFPSGPNGRGWVSVAYIQISATDNLPVFDELGQPVIVQSGTPLPTPTPTLVAAAADGDSAESPSVNPLFSPSGVRLLSFRSDVSRPDGDLEDWVGFRSTGSLLRFSLECSGNGTLQTRLLANGQPQAWKGLNCGDKDVPFTAENGKTYLLQLSVDTQQTGLRYVNYLVTITINP